MSDLLKTMANDLRIMPYYGENESDYCYRVCYSALALSLLYSARSTESSKTGISKKAQTDLMQRILIEYGKCLNLDVHKLNPDSNNFVAQCRKVYESLRKTSNRFASNPGVLVKKPRPREKAMSFGTPKYRCPHSKGTVRPYEATISNPLSSTIK